MIDLRRGAARATARTASFSRYDGREPALRNAGGRTAYVTLQENNAVAVVDIRSATVRQLLPLGRKLHSTPGQGLDPSDKDGGAEIGTWPVQGMFMPDSIASYSARGATYLVTANEGDARDWDCFDEEVRASRTARSCWTRWCSRTQPRSRRTRTWVA